MDDLVIGIIEAARVVLHLVPGETDEETDALLALSSAVESYDASHVEAGR